MGGESAGRILSMPSRADAAASSLSKTTIPMPVDPSPDRSQTPRWKPGSCFTVGITTSFSSRSASSGFRPSKLTCVMSACAMWRSSRHGQGGLPPRTGSVTTVPSAWPVLQPYDVWSATCDSLHAYTQVLGKLAVELAPPEPQLQHAALRLSGRGWETQPLPAPDRSGALTVALDLRDHNAVVEHSDGRAHRVPLMPDRPVAEVTRAVMAAV